MNVTVLEKLEKGWICLDWIKYLPKVNLSDKQLSELVDKLDNWKSNKKCREIILIKYKNIPAYITLKREDFQKMGLWLMNRLTKLEMYEECARLQLMMNKL